MMELFTVYHGLEDYPGKYVVRRTRVRSGQVDTELLIVTNALSEARQVIPPGLYRTPRWPEDEPQILEVWL